MHESYWALRGEMLKPANERKTAVIEEQQCDLRGLLQYLEEALGDRNFFLDDFSLVDIALVARALRMEAYRALPAPSLPRLSAWLQRMKERPSVKSIR